MFKYLAAELVQLIRVVDSGAGKFVYFLHRKGGADELKVRLRLGKEAE